MRPRNTRIHIQHLEIWHLDTCIDHAYIYIYAYHGGGLWWLEHDAVASGERGGGLLDGDQQRVVPRGDEAADPERHAAYVVEVICVREGGHLVKN